MDLKLKDTLPEEESKVYIPKVEKANEFKMWKVEIIRDNHLISISEASE